MIESAIDNYWEVEDNPIFKWHMCMNCKCSPPVLISKKTGRGFCQSCKIRRESFEEEKEIDPLAEQMLIMMEEEDEEESRQVDIFSQEEINALLGATTDEDGPWPDREEWDSNTPVITTYDFEHNCVKIKREDLGKPIILNIKKPEAGYTDNGIFVPYRAIHPKSIQ